MKTAIFMTDSCLVPDTCSDFLILQMFLTQIFMMRS